MLVGEILNLVAELSIGLDSPTADDIPIFLNYLNLAHFELFSQTATVNPIVNIQRDVLAVTDGVVDPLTHDVFSFRSVYRADLNVQIHPTSIDKIIERDPSNITTGDPSFWYYSNGRLNVWPLFTQGTDIGGIGVLYNTQPAPLGQNDDLSDYYPIGFHPLLVEGTCYYLFQSETGFKNDAKMNRSYKRWKDGKTILYNYLITLGSGKTFRSTYSRI